jgi:predicted Fe-Mo cluster-binding NifX family protein
MKLVVTAQGADLHAPVDPRFGRAEYFLLVDTETSDFTSLNNAVNLNAAQGAGIQAARQVVELGAQGVLTGHVGPKAFAVLAAAGVAVYTGAAGTVAQALEQFQRGQLRPAQAADVEGHWV